MLAARVPRLLAALKSATREEYWVSCSESKRSLENGIHMLHAFINNHSSHSHTVILLLNLVWLPIYLWWFSPNTPGGNHGNLHAVTIWSPHLMSTRHEFNQLSRCWGRPSESGGHPAALSGRWSRNVPTSFSLGILAKWCHQLRPFAATIWWVFSTMLGSYVVGTIWPKCAFTSHSCSDAMNFDGFAKGKLGTGGFGHDISESIGEHE